MHTSGETHITTDGEVCARALAHRAAAGTAPLVPRTPGVDGDRRTPGGDHGRGTGSATASPPARRAARPSRNGHLRVAMIGTRGVPARYGGFETAVEEIGRRLVQRGHDVTVYCRDCGSDPGGTAPPTEHLGMHLVTLPALRVRSAETLSHSALASLHALLTRGHDVVFLFNSANAVFLPLLRACRLPVAVHVDGFEWQRRKWSGAGRHYYRMAEALAVRWADALIADAPAIAEYFGGEFRASTELLAYGAPVLGTVPDDRLTEFDVVPEKFHLVVSRFEPENQVDVIARGYCASTATLPLVLVGGAPYADSYISAIRALAESDPRIKLVGPVWDQAKLNQLYGHALLYLHGHSVGGTNPSLLRAMGAGAAVATYDVRFNRDVVGRDSWLFSDEKGVAEVVEAAERDTERCRAYGSSLRERVARRYRWDDVAEGYESLATRLADGYSRRGEATGRRCRPRRPLEP